MSNEKENDKPSQTVKGESPSIQKQEVSSEKTLAAAEKVAPQHELGRYGSLLKSNRFSPIALGNDNGGIEMIEIKPEELRETCEFLRNNSASLFDLLVSISGVDWKDRLEAVYHLYSTSTFDKLVIKATAVDEKLPSVVPIWKTAEWHECETYDLLGIIFEGHPDLYRILMPSDWIGYPLRKNYSVKDERLVWNER